MNSSTKTHRFVAFLRGINVGGNNTIKMDALRSQLEAVGFEDVKTILASGNVVFTTKLTGEAVLERKIAKCIKDAFDREIGVIVRPFEAIRRLVDNDPFNGAKRDASTKFHVTFLPRKMTRHPEPPGIKGLSVVSTTPTEVFSSVTLSAGVGTLDLMSWLDKSYGKAVTTRTWNTISKILKAVDT